MTQNQKYKRAIADITKLVEDKEKRREFAKDLFLLDRRLREARLGDFIFEAHMQTAEQEWNTQS